MSAGPARDTELYWDRGAASYDAAHDREARETSPLWIRMAVVLRLLGERPGSVVDCGMGPGRLLVELAGRGWQVSGIDLSGEMVARARNRLPEHADRLLQASVEVLPFDATSFDAAVATGVLEYVQDVPRALHEVARVLRPDGVFVVAMPNTRAPATIWRHSVVYPVVRAAKLRLRSRRPAPLPRPGRISLRRLAQELASVEMDIVHVEYIVITRRGGMRSRARFRREIAWKRLRPLLGTQVVVATRKRQPSG